MAILPNAFDVYADVIETEGQNYDLVENFFIGEAVWTSHVERILDGTWKNYVLENNSDKVIWNSNAVGSFIWDKNSCSYSIYEKGWTDPSKQIIPSVSSVGTYLNNGNWENLDVNDENCVTEVLKYKEFAIIKSTKTITEDVTTPVFKEWTGTETEFNESIALNGTSFTLQNINGTQGFYNGQTITNSGVEIEKFVQEIRLDIHNGFKETFKIWKNNGNQQLGISQTAHIPNGQIVIADEVISISEFSGQSFDRQYLEDNEAEIFEITDKLHYNFDKGFPFLTNVNIIDDGNFKVNMDYSDGGFVGYLEIDPTFGYTDGTWKRYYSDLNQGQSSCATRSVAGADTNNQGILRSENTGGRCQVYTVNNDISSLPTNPVISSANIQFTVSSVSSPNGLDVFAVTNDPSTASNSVIWTDVFDGNQYVDDSTTGDSTGSKTLDLGTTAKSDITSLRSSNNNDFTFSLVQGNWDNISGTSETTLNLSSSSVALELTYEIPIKPQPPTNLQTTAGMPIGLDWDIPSSDGNSAITGYKVFRTTEQYSQVELPENSQNADGVDFTGNELLLRGAESVTQVPLVVNNNFASNSGFTLGQMSVSNNKLSGTVASSGSTTYLDLRSENIDHDKWNMRFGLKITGTNTGSLNPLFIGLADYASIYNSNFASGDHIGTVLYTSDAQPYNLRVVNDETTEDYTRSSSTPVTNTQYYVEIIKNGANTSVRYYDSADFTDSGSSLPLLQGSNAGSVSGFDYFIVKPYNSGSGSHTIEITDLKVYSGITDSTSSTTYNIIEDKSSNDIEISNFGSAIQKHRDSYDWLSLGFKMADETTNSNNRYVDVSPTEESGTDPTLTIIADGTTYTLVATEDLSARGDNGTGCASPNTGSILDSSVEWFVVTVYPTTTYDKCVRGMAEFDISSIPTTASIQSATMTWKVDGNTNDSTDRIEVYVMDQQGTTLTGFTDLYQGISSGELITNAIEISGTGEKTFDISALTTPYFNTKQNGILNNGIINPNFSFTSTDIFDNTDNFSLGSWVKYTPNADNIVVDWNGKGTNSDQYLTIDLGSGNEISETQWTLRFTNEINNISAASGSAGNWLAIGMADGNGGSANDSGQDFIGVLFRDDGGGSSGDDVFSLDSDGSTDIIYDGTDTQMTGTYGSNLSTGKHNVEIIRTSATAYTVNMYNSDWTSVVDTIGGTTSSSADNLRYFLVDASSDFTTNSNAFDGQITDVKLYDGVTSATGTPTAFATLVTPVGSQITYNADNSLGVSNPPNSKLLEFNTVDFTVSNSVAKIEESEIVTTYKPFVTSVGTTGNSISQNADGTYTKTGSSGWNTKAYNPTSFSSSTGSTLEVVFDGTNQMFGFRNDVPTSSTITGWDYLLYCGNNSCQHYYNSYNYGNCNGQTGFTYTFINGISIGDSVKLEMDSSGVVKSYLNDVAICTFGGQYVPSSASGNWYEYITRYGAGSSSGPMTENLVTTTILEKTGLTNSQTDFEHHAFTRDGSTWTYYKNGQSEATATSTESLGSNTGINYNIDYQGVLDEYFIDNTALSASTIDSIYDRGVSPTQIGTTNSATTEFDDNNSLVAGTEYYYTVKATNAVGDSNFLTPLVSATAGVPADPPTNIQASISNTATAPLDVTVTWSPPSNVGTGTLTGFEIFRDGVSVGTVGLVQTFPDTVPSSGTYAYTVKSLSTHGTSVASSADSITTPSAPSQPTLTVTALDSTSIKLDWTASNANGSTLQGYFVEYSLDNSLWQTLVTNTGNTDLTRTATGLNPDDQYYWRVSGINGVGNGTPSIVKNTWTLLVGPTNLVATAMSENQIDLAWTGISGISSYTIQFESPTGNGFTDLATSISTSDTTYTSGSLTTGTQYNYRIVGISSNSGLASTPSNESSANTFGILPAPVLDTLTSVTVNPATVQLDWTAPTGSPSATGYKIERNLGSGFVTIETDSGSTSTTYLDQATTALNEPQYRVSAINSYGVSDPSNELTLTTTSSGGQGGGGGGGGSSSSSQQTTIIDDLLNVSLVGNTHIMTVGEFLTGKIPVSWDSGENLRISEISYDSSILGSIKFNIEESTPIILQGSGNSFSSGDITYTISTPNDLCSSTIKNNCLVEKVYSLPVTITSTSSGDTLTQKTVITIDTSAGFGGQTLALLSIFIMAIIAGVGIIKFARKSNGKGKRKSIKSSNGKKKARKSVN